MRCVTPHTCATAGALLLTFWTVLCVGFLKSDLPKDFLKLGTFLLFLYRSPALTSPTPFKKEKKIIARLVTDSSAKIGSSTLFPDLA